MWKRYIRKHHAHLHEDVHSIVLFIMQINVFTAHNFGNISWKDAFFTYSCHKIYNIAGVYFIPNNTFFKIRMFVWEIGGNFVKLIYTCIFNNHLIKAQTRKSFVMLFWLSSAHHILFLPIINNQFSVKYRFRHQNFYREITQRAVKKEGFPSKINKYLLNNIFK